MSYMSDRAIEGAETVKEPEFMVRFHDMGTPIALEAETNTSWEAMRNKSSGKSSGSSVESAQLTLTEKPELGKVISIQYPGEEAPRLLEVTNPMESAKNSEKPGERNVYVKRVNPDAKRLAELQTAGKIVDLKAMKPGEATKNFLDTHFSFSSN